MLNLLKIFVLGVSILLVAIILNIVAAKLSLTGWYDYLQYFGKKTPSLVSYLWLFIMYPLLLGAAAYLASRLLWK